MAIANQRLVSLDEHGVTFRWKDYRAKGRTKHKVMTLSADEFIRRFLLHILPTGFHRIRHYGFMANGKRRDGLSKIRGLLHADEPMPISAVADQTESGEQAQHTRDVSAVFVCPACQTAMVIIEILPPRHSIRAPPSRGAIQ